MFADISDGLAVIINSETGMYYGMNPFASDIFQNIISGASDEDIVAAAVKIGAPENFEASFDKLVAGLLEKEIIVPAEHKQMQANLNAAFAENKLIGPGRTKEAIASALCTYVLLSII